MDENPRLEQNARKKADSASSSAASSAVLTPSSGSQWIAYTAEAIRRPRAEDKAKKRTLVPNSTSVSSKAWTASTSTTEVILLNANSLLSQSSTEVIVQSRRESDASLTEELAPVAFQDNILATFVKTQFLFPHAPTFPWNANGSFCGIIHDPTTVQSATAQESVRAISSVYFGRMHQQPAFMTRALTHYGSALRAMNKELQKSSHPSTSLLKSAITLEIFELLAFGSKTGWMKHAGGLGKLMQLLGPRRFQNPEDGYLLEVNKTVIFIDCLLSRKYCFLGDENWKTIPVFPPFLAFT